MANRRYYQFYKSLERDVNQIYAIFTVGATGAVPALSTRPGQNLGIHSITRTGIGAYTITFGDRINGNFDKYSDNLGIAVTYQHSTAPAAPICISTGQSNPYSIGIQFYGPTNSSTTTLIPTDPDQNAVIRIVFTMRGNSKP